MARKPSPWYWPERSAWFTILNGRRVPLGEHPADGPPPTKRKGKWVAPASIDLAFHTLLSRPQSVPSVPSAPVMPATGLTVAEVYEKFLDWCLRHRAPRTYKWSKKHIQTFLNALPDPSEMPAIGLRPYHVQEWVDSKTTWGANQRRGAIVAVTRPFNWAAKLGYITTSPVRGVEKPTAERRDCKLTPADFARLRALVKDKPFGDLLDFSWECGCRPQEARHVEARHLRLDHHRVEIPPAEAKGKKRWRVIYLTPAAEEIVRLLAAARPEGKLFRNVDGNPWKVDAVNCRFGRLKSKLGVRFAMYDLRHCFSTRKLKEGYDPITVASLLGHTDATMLCRHYEGVSGDGEHLLGAVNGRGPGRPSA